MSEQRLFSATNAQFVREQRHSDIRAEIDQLPEDRLLNTTVDDLVDYFVAKYTLDVPVLLEDQAQSDQREMQRDVSRDPTRVAFDFGGGTTYAKGIEVSVEVPFSGHSGLFNVRPDTFSSSAPEGELKSNSMVFHHWTDSNQPAQVRAAYDSWLSRVKQYLLWHRGTFGPFNGSLANFARTTINERRNRLLANRSLVESLGIPLKHRADSQGSYAAPEVRRKLTPKLPPATPGVFKPEPILEESEYRYILDIIERMVLVMERSPSIFHRADEEELRDMLLVNLNGHYEGQATGETFNSQGKTDILIRSEDRNIFIAECKIWRGPASLSKAIDQLLGYVTWRDSKSAIILFNRNKGFSEVLSAIPGVVTNHQNFYKDHGKQGETRFRYTFRNQNDAAKLLHLTVMAFDIPNPT